MVKVLFIDDDATIRETTRQALQGDGFDVRAAADGRDGLSAFAAERPDVALIDVMLPVVDGITVCRKIRAESQVPIVMLSARSDAIDVVLGLEAGADDYVTKPFDIPVLAARLRAAVRRAGDQWASRLLAAGDLAIDTGAAQVCRAGQPIALTPTEYRLLADLAEHAGLVRSRDQLLQSVWGYSWSGDTRLVDVHVQRLRVKIGADCIRTVRGLGYRIERS
jgi:DNA-binding response OmpR family regulator